MNRSFLMLAHDYDPVKHDIRGWYASIKYDGVRAFWDGGVSRGMTKRQVPWANTQKDERFVVPPMATGLWSRYGNVIHAPDYFLDALPKGVLLDGELYLERGAFQETKSIVSQIHPDDRWKKIRYMVIDKPTQQVVFDNGATINEANWKDTVFDHAACMKLFGHRYDPVPQFKDTAAILRTDLQERPFVEPADQVKLSMDGDECAEQLREMLDKEVLLGGEGVIVRRPDSVWIPYRTYNLLKVKKTKDSEATIIGFITGREGKEGRRLGKIGAIVCRWDDGPKGSVEFKMAGLKNDEIDFKDESGTFWAYHNPEQFTTYPGSCFKVGDVITFTYMTVTNDGLPREPRYLRKA